MLLDAQYNIEYDSKSISTEPKQLEEEAKIEFIKEMVGSGMNAGMAKVVIEEIYAMIRDSVGRHI